MKTLFIKKTSFFLFNKSLPKIVLFSSLSFAHLLNAGGFQLSDHSVTSLGRAHAGYGVVGDDASAAHYNPAGMTLLDHQVQLGISRNLVSAKFKDDGTSSFSGDDEDGTTNASVPNFHYVVPVGDGVFFGLSITAPFATHTKYSDDFIGRYNGLETQITTKDINPSIAFKLNENVSFGMGISYQTFDTTLSAFGNPALPEPNQIEITGNSDGYGYNLGLMFELNDDHRLGLGYRSEINHNISGDIEFSGGFATTPVVLPPLVIVDTTGKFNATSDFTSPATAYLGYHGGLTNRFSISLGARWTEWSSLDEIIIDAPTALATQQIAIETQWDNSMTYMLGGDYHLNNQLTFRAGLGIDETPVPDDFRSARTVDSDRTWYALGAGYKATNKLTLDFALRYITLEDAPVNQTIEYSPPVGNQTLNGEYTDMSITTYAIQANYRF